MSPRRKGWIGYGLTMALCALLGLVLGLAGIIPCLIVATLYALIFPDPRTLSNQEDDHA